MMIFDGFPIEAKAREFAAHVISTYGRDAVVCLTEEEARQLDVFPFDVTPPIVMVSRDFNDFEKEPHIIRDARIVYGGDFAGT